MQELAGSVARVPLDQPCTQERARRWWLDNGGKSPVEKLPTLAPAQDLAIAAPGENRLV
jgi:hypothetical protein